MSVVLRSEFRFLNLLFTLEQSLFEKVVANALKFNVCFAILLWNENNVGILII